MAAKHKVTICVFTALVLSFFCGPQAVADVLKNTKRAMRILDRIAVAANLHASKPAIMVGSTPNVGYFDFQKRLIMLDSGLFEIAERFGERADHVLSLIIGHEYAHYVRGHEFDGKFQHAFGSFATISPVNTFEAKMLVGKQAESEADYFGIFYALLAGYDITLTECTQMSNLVANHFGHSPNDSLALIDEHPSSVERLDIAKQVLDEMRQLVHLHDVANVALMTGQYLQAAVLYERICKNVNIPSVNWNELLARYLYVQELAKKPLVDPGIIRNQFVSEFAYRSSSQLVKLDIEQMLYRCRSLVDIIRAARYNETALGRMERILSLFQESQECAGCTSGSVCALHAQQGKDIEREISASPGYAIASKESESTIDPKEMLNVSTSLDVQLTKGTFETVPVSIGTVKLFTIESEGTTMLRCEFRAPKSRGTHRIDMRISPCENCDSSTATQRDNIIRQTAVGKHLQAAVFSD